MSRTARNFVLALVLVIVVVVAGYGVHHRTTTTTTTTVATTTTTTTTTSTTTTVPTSTTTAPASLTTCRGSQFAGTNVGSQGAAGTGYDTMTLTKTSPGTCVVDGYPLITLLDAQGAPISGFSVAGATDLPAPANGPPVALTISAGQRVGVELRYSDIPIGNAACPTVSQVDVRFVAGDQAVPVTFTYPIQPCEGNLAVSPFYRG